MVFSLSAGSLSGPRASARRQHSSSSGSGLGSSAALHAAGQRRLRTTGGTRLVVMRGILDSFRREQQQQQQQKAGGGAAAPPVPAPLSSGSGSDEDASTVIQSILMDGITFTEEDTPCPTDCVLEVFSDEELSAILRSALPEALIVVDWYKDDCTACKYMAPVFHRACRSSSEHAKQIIFVKHNIYDEEGELTPLARKYKFKSVPTFTFHKNGQLVESFATNKKDRLTEAINKHAPVVVSRWADEDE